MSDGKRDLPRWPEVLTEYCPTCGKPGHWSSPEPNAAHVPPVGHTEHRTPDGATYDTCPKVRQP